MVLILMRNNSKIYLLFAILLLLLSCDDKIIIVNCSDCTADEPEKADIVLKLEPETGSFVLVRVYRGPLEDNIMIDSFTTESTQYTYTADLNTKYTFTAEYLLVTGTTIVVVNSAYPRVKYEKDQCEHNCFFVYGNKVNLRIKYH